MSEEIKEQVAPEANTEATSNPPAASGPDLNVSDLVGLKSIIEIATQRGAFKANELEAVGKTFNKLNTFLEAVAKKES
jgi:hypothetical protein